MMENYEIAERTLRAMESQDEFNLEVLTEKARIARNDYKLALDNLITLRQLENGAVIRYEVK